MTQADDQDISVQEAVKQIIAKLGENIVVRRFERLTLGEGLEKKERTRGKETALVSVRVGRSA